MPETSTLSAQQMNARLTVEADGLEHEAAVAPCQKDRIELEDKSNLCSVEVDSDIVATTLVSGYGGRIGRREVLMSAILFFSMDALRAEINSKRKALQDESARPTKYMRRGEIERMKEEAKARELKEREEAQQREEEAKAFVHKEKLVSLVLRFSSFCILICKLRADSFTFCYQFAPSRCS